VLCQHYKCVFIHIPKTAGQSIEHIFLRLLGLRWETRAPLLLRYNDQPELGPPMLMHMKAADYVRGRYMTEEQFGSYFKFSFVRNPWDRVVSFYRYLGLSNRMDFKRFVMTTFRTEIWNTGAWFVGPQYEYVCNEHGEIVADFIGKFENLQSDFNQVCHRIGLAPQTIPHLNPSTETEQRGTGPEVLLREIGLTPQDAAVAEAPRAIAVLDAYQACYDETSIQVVADLYRKDIELFGYDFE
jgi:Sulfotransferase family